MIPDKTKATGCNRVALIKANSKNKSIVEQGSIKSNFVCDPNFYFSKTKSEEDIDKMRIQLANTKKNNNILIDTKKDQSQNQDQNEVVNRLAKLSFLEYGQVRKEEAAKLDVTVGILDSAVKAYRQSNLACSVNPVNSISSTSKNNKNELENGIKPWDCSVAGQSIADEIQALIKNHIILSEDQITILTIWIFGSYCIDAFGIFPKLLITSPEKRCGKTFRTRHP